MIKNKRGAALHAATEGEYHRVGNILYTSVYTLHTLYILYVYRDVYTKKHTFNARTHARLYVLRTYARMRKIANVHIITAISLDSLFAFTIVRRWLNRSN